MANNLSYVPVCPRMDWTNVKNIAEEYSNFEDMVELMWCGPLKDAQDNEKFGYVKLWSVPKSISLWKNSGKTDKTVNNILQVLKEYCIPSDRRFWTARLEFRQLAQRSGENIQDFANERQLLVRSC